MYLALRTIPEHKFNRKRIPVVAIYETFVSGLTHTEHWFDHKWILVVTTYGTFVSELTLTEHWFDRKRNSVINTNCLPEVLSPIHAFGSFVRSETN